MIVKSRTTTIKSCSKPFVGTRVGDDGGDDHGGGGGGGGGGSGIKIPSFLCFG